MERTIIQQSLRLGLQCEATPFLAVIEQELAALQKFIGYFEPEEQAFQPEAVDVLVSRVHYLLLPHADIPEAVINELLIGDIKAATPELQQALNIESALHWAADNKPAMLDMSYLQHIHGIVLHRMPNAHCAGLLRTRMSHPFKENEPGSGLPDGSALNQLLEDTLLLANDESRSALVRCWLVYYAFMILQPFYAENEIIAQIACHYIMEKEGYGFWGLLNMEKFIFHASDFRNEKAAIFGDALFAEKIRQNMQPFVEACLQLLDHNIQTIKSSVIAQIRQQLNYNALSCRQKNNMNFWLGKGFFLHRNIIEQLTSRQQEIIILLTRYISLSTKELVPLFQVDRKTIQRDFCSLESQGIIEGRGAGRNLKYHFDLKVF